jgi:hypothetical protein
VRVRAGKKAAKREAPEIMLCACERMIKQSLLCLERRANTIFIFMRRLLMLWAAVSGVCRRAARVSPRHHVASPLRERSTACRGRCFASVVRTVEPAPLKLLNRNADTRARRAVTQQRLAEVADFQTVRTERQHTQRTQTAHAQRHSQGEPVPCTHTLCFTPLCMCV